ncbi:MAG: hypothetical protein CM1200mP29_10900 [Verrucomicrobiota bacterium]|nr:MAG: hypothetical protein CM1200mP29_10900 [Verrucomicrobiota bacterium]
MRLPPEGRLWTLGAWEQQTLMRMLFSNCAARDGGRMEHFSIQTAAHLASFPGVQADCVTMDEAFNLRYGRLHSLYFFRRFDRATIFREPREAIEQQLGQARYVQCATFAELREGLGQYDLVYSRNEITRRSCFACASATATCRRWCLVATVLIVSSARARFTADYKFALRLAAVHASGQGCRWVPHHLARDTGVIGGSFRSIQ